MKAIALLMVLSGSAMAGGMVQGGATPASAALSESTVTATQAYFGSAPKSTFTATGNLNVSGTLGSPSATFLPALSSFTTTGTAGLTGTFLTTTLSTCVAGSTVSLSLPIAGSVAVYFTGSISNASLGGLEFVGVMVDGTFTNGETASKGLVTVKEQVATDTNNMSFSTIVTGLAAGSHSFCLAVASTVGAGTIDNTNSIATLSVYMLP